jgi:phosphoglycolate phosphatase
MERQRVKAVIFDLDGTLIDSAPDIHAAVNRMLAEQGLLALDLAKVIGFIGNGLPKLVELVMQARGIDMTRHADLTATVLAFYSAASADLTVLYPNVRTTLETLKSYGYRLAVCTNKPEAATHLILSEFGLADYFDVVIGGDTLPQRKPDPTPLLTTVARLSANQSLYVGDSEVDAETARAAGISFALFTEGYRKTPISDLPHDFAFSDFAVLSEYAALKLASDPAA